MRPETRYAKSGPVNIAYQVVGEGPIDLVLFPGFVSHVEVVWEQPKLAHFLFRLAAFARLIIFDKRGTGMSDPTPTPPTMDERMDDVRAVMDAVGSQRASILGVSEGGTLSLLFSLTHPERVDALVLYGSWARRLAAPDYPWGIDPEVLEGRLDAMEEAWSTGEWWGLGRPSADDDEHRTWWARYLRMAASPTMAQDVIRMNCEIDLRERLSEVKIPTLVLHRAHDNWLEVGHGRHLAEHISSARYVELEGTDHRFWLGDVESILTEIEVFLTGGKQRPRQRRLIGPDSLSRRQREVAVLAAGGRTATEIAEHLVIGSRTVESHLVAIYRKLGVANKAELIRRAGELGL